MNLQDKRIGKGEIRNFFRALAYWIDDPQTFYNFALVNKIAKEACEEFRAMKMYEFSNIKEYVLSEFLAYTIFKILPNGNIHGISTHGYQDIDNGGCSSDFVDYYYNGKLISTTSYIENPYNSDIEISAEAVTRSTCIVLLPIS